MKEFLEVQPTVIFDLFYLIYAGWREAPSPPRLRPQIPTLGVRLGRAVLEREEKFWAYNLIA